MIPAFEADELDDEQLGAFLTHYRECATCREDLSIQLLVDRGLDHLETGKSFNLRKEVEQTVTESSRRLKARRKLEKIAYTLELVTVGIALAAGLSVKENGKYRYDSFDHEQSLVFDTPHGLFVMNSCSHAGADNIVKEIEATFPGKKIYALLGGFHLFRYKDEKVRAFAERLHELDVQHIYTGHCTGNRAYEILRGILGNRAQQMFTGLTIEI